MDNDSIVRRLDIEGDGLVDQDSIETSSDIVGDVFVEENYLARRVEQQRCLLSVAIDFGTTFSGYAFSFEADFKRDPLTISASQWKAPGHSSLKTPTSLLLSKDKSFVAFGYEAEKEYANLAIEDKHHEHFFFKTFKMQLYQNKKGCEVMEDINGKILPSVTVFAESIEYLKGHFWSKIQAHGDVFTINEDEIRWVLTVPAIWDDFAKNVMRQAAIKAGIPDDNLILALEPEAASIYCQHLYTRRDQKQFDVTKEGTKFMVLDLGGGTADITVQEKLQDGKLREIRRATGGPFGGSAVNDSKHLLSCSGIL